MNMGKLPAEFRPGGRCMVFTRFLKGVKLKSRICECVLLQLGVVPRVKISQTFRAAVLGCLLLTQVQLLWIAAFHWNEEVWPSLASAATVRDGSHTAIPSNKTKSPCLVCQIVRQNAVWPGMGPLTPQPLSIFLLRHVVPSVGFHSFQPNVANGRAPPLC